MVKYPNVLSLIFQRIVLFCSFFVGVLSSNSSGQPSSFQWVSLLSSWRSAEVKVIDTWGRGNLGTGKTGRNKKTNTICGFADPKRLFRLSGSRFFPLKCFDCLQRHRPRSCTWNYVSGFSRQATRNEFVKTDLRLDV